MVLKYLNVLIDLKSSIWSLGTWAISRRRSLSSYFISVPPYKIKYIIRIYLNIIIDEFRSSHKTYLDVRSRFVGYFHYEFQRRFRPFTQQRLQDFYVHRSTKIIYVWDKTIFAALEGIRVSFKRIIAITYEHWK